MFICWAEENLPGPQAENLFVRMRKLPFTFIFFPWLTWADSVEVLDGSIIQGKIIGMVDGNLTIKPPSQGKLKFHTDISINSDKEISFDLLTTELLTVLLIEQKMIRHHSGATVVFALRSNIYGLGYNRPLILEVQNALAMLMKWKHAIGFDLTGASGNTDSFGLGIRLDSSLGNRMREYDFILS